jgi:predicted aspartyl protease
VWDGTVSNHRLLNPSKPFNLYATLTINNAPIQTLIDTGASATCISQHALQRISGFRYVDRTPRSFLLADGVCPLQVTGRVELFLRFGYELIHFYALVTEKLCIDLVLGMDFMIAYRRCP